MEEAAKKFIGKRCYIYLLSGEVDGTILEVNNRSLLVETSSDTQLINLDFVLRIREFSKKKRKKSAAGIQV